MSYIQLKSEQYNQQYIEDVIGDFISGVTGLKRNDIRPAHQPIHPTYKQNETICVFNIAKHITKGYWGGYKKSVKERSELEINVFFYGYNSYEECRKLIRGTFIDQNKYELLKKNMSVMKYTDIIEIPVNINGIEVLRHNTLMTVSFASDVSYEENYFEIMPKITVYGG